jgi:hypothetical protein
MKDVFFTILAIWVVWRIMESIKGSSKKEFNGQKKYEGEVTVEYRPPSKKDKDDKDGEYIDYEEIK